MKLIRKPSQHLSIHLLLATVSLLLILIPYINKTPSLYVTQVTEQAAAEFLFLVDTEEYSRSWEVTSDTLKRMLSEQAWLERIAELRSLLGPIIERARYEVAYASSSGDVPAGEYVVMTFISRFELREKVIEKLTLMLGDDGRWQVVGYFMS
jgi:hypothetical protein